MAGPLKKLKSGRDGTQNSKPQRQQNFASAFAQCPVCSKEVPHLTINFHVDECLAAQDSTRRPHGSDAASQALVPGNAAAGDMDATASPDAPALMLSLGGSSASCSHSQPSSSLPNRAGPAWPMFASGSSLKGPYVIRDAPLLTCFGGPNRLVCFHVNLGQAYCADPLDLLSAMIYPSCSHPVHTQGPARAVAFRGICDRG